MNSLLIPAQTYEDGRVTRPPRRVTIVWVLLFVNTLGYPGKAIVPLPHKVGQMLTQGALLGALGLALSVNSRVFIRPNLFLGLFTLLGLSALMMSVRLVSLGTAYRGVRLLLFIAVLWLLTPWWRDRELTLLRTQFIILSVIVVSLVIGIPISPTKAFTLNYGVGRLTDVIWPMVTTKAAHYMAELTGLSILLWICGMIRRRPALLLICSGFLTLLATRTRTALVGLLVGLLISLLSLFLAKRSVRRVFTISLVLIVTVVVPLSPLITTWLARGQSSKALHELSGRTRVWALVLSESRPETNKIFGSGLSNDGLLNSTPAMNGLPIDSSWMATYQNEGVVGIVLEGLMFLVLLFTALLRPRGPTRAIALYLIVYCLIASYTQTGVGEPSLDTLDLALAASLLLPRAGGTETWIAPHY